VLHDALDARAGHAEVPRQGAGAHLEGYKILLFEDFAGMYRGQNAGHDV
jgi:hypothetical protein